MSSGTINPPEATEAPTPPGGVEPVKAAQRVPDAGEAGAPAAGPGTADQIYDLLKSSAERTYPREDSAHAVDRYIAETADGQRLYSEYTAKRERAAAVRKAQKAASLDDPDSPRAEAERRLDELAEARASKKGVTKQAAMGEVLAEPDGSRLFGYLRD